MSDENREPTTDWYKHHSREGRGDFCLALDFEGVEKPPINNPEGEMMIQLCPSCGHRMTAYHAGFAAMADDFKECVCGNCFTALFRWSSVVATKTAAKSLTTEQLQRYVKTRANEAFWRGEMSRTSPAMLNGMGEPPTPILGTKGVINDVVGEWEPRCPCCGRLEDADMDFDFHHWDYEHDIGCQICRECHANIHQNRRASEQEELTGDWRADAIQRLHRLSVSNGLTFTTPTEFEIRFNIPLTLDKWELLKEEVVV